MSKPITGLVFKMAEPKKKRQSKGTVLSKTVMCICTKSEDGEFKANLRIISTTQRATNLLIPFTTKSYNCKGRLKVFTKKPDKHGKYVLHWRTVEQARIATVNSILYTPLCEDWVYSGHIVQINGKRQFDITEAIWHKDFYHKSLDIDETDIKI